MRTATTTAAAAAKAADDQNRLENHPLDCAMRQKIIARFGAVGAAIRAKLGARTKLILTSVVRPMMSALGQKRTWRDQNCNVRFTPNSGHPSAQFKCPLWGQ
jgi:hypothetical protein